MAPGSGWKLQRKLRPSGCTQLSTVTGVREPALISIEEKGTFSLTFER